MFSHGYTNSTHHLTWSFFRKKLLERKFVVFLGFPKNLFSKQFLSLITDKLLRKKNRLISEKLWKNRMKMAKKPQKLLESPDFESCNLFFLSLIIIMYLVISKPTTSLISYQNIKKLKNQIKRAFLGLKCSENVLSLAIVSMGNLTKFYFSLFSLFGFVTSFRKKTWFFDDKYVKTWRFLSGWPNFFMFWEVRPCGKNTVEWTGKCWNFMKILEKKWNIEFSDFFPQFTIGGLTFSWFGKLGHEGNIL